MNKDSLNTAIQQMRYEDSVEQVEEHIILMNEVAKMIPEKSDTLTTMTQQFDRLQSMFNDEFTHFTTWLYIGLGFLTIVAPYFLYILERRSKKNVDAKIKEEIEKAEKSIAIEMRKELNEQVNKSNKKYERKFKKLNNQLEKATNKTYAAAFFLQGRLAKDKKDYFSSIKNYLKSSIQCAKSDLHSDFRSAISAVKKTIDKEHDKLTFSKSEKQQVTEILDELKECLEEHKKFGSANKKETRELFSSIENNLEL